MSAAAETLSRTAAPASPGGDGHPDTHGTRPLVALALGAAIALGAISWFALRSGADVIATQGRVTQTLQVLRAAGRVEAALLRAEGVQRLSLLRGEISRIDELETEAGEAREAVSTLAALTVDNAAQRGRVNELRELLERRLEHMRGVSRLRQQGDVAGAVATLGTGEFQELRAALRRKLEQVVALEESFLEARHEAQRAATARARDAYLAFASAGVALLAALVVAQFRYRQARELAHAAIESRESQLRRIADGLPQLVYVTDGEGNMLLANRQWHDFTGLPPESIRRGEELDFVHPEDLPGVITAWTRALASGEPYEHELRVRRCDGAWIWHLSRAVPVPDPGTGGSIWLGTMTNVDERRRSEIRAKESAERIAALNQELEAFSYSVSHDLRAPLRHIDGFAALLERQIAPAIAADAKAKRYLATIRAAASDMGRLIDDLLAFARLGRQPLRRTLLPLEPIVRKAIESSTGEDPGRAIEWKIADLPEVEGDPALLQVVFDNLLGNAVKYTRPRQVARIEVGGYVAPDGRRHVEIRDNGVGFDPRFAEKLFGVFQRLHSEKEFEGTGIGLATVRRVVERHGGEIRGEGSVGEGATFHLTFPAR